MVFVRYVAVLVTREGTYPLVIPDGKDSLIEKVKKGRSAEKQQCRAENAPIFVLGISM